MSLIFGSRTFKLLETKEEEVSPNRNTSFLKKKDVFTNFFKNIVASTKNIFGLWRIRPSLDPLIPVNIHPNRDKFCVLALKLKKTKKMKISSGFNIRERCGCMRKCL